MSAICHSHYTTFARVHRASPAELSELRAFAASLGHSELEYDWASALADIDFDVILAFEGGILMGVIAGFHDPARATAELAWIGVSPSARRRGIGRLLLDNYSDAAHGRGAMSISAPDDQPSVSALMLAMGGRWRGSTLVVAIQRDASAAQQLPTLRVVREDRS